MNWNCSCSFRTNLVLNSPAQHPTTNTVRRDVNSPIARIFILFPDESSDFLSSAAPATPSSSKARACDNYASLGAGAAARVSFRVACDTILACSSDATIRHGAPPRRGASIDRAFGPEKPFESTSWGPHMRNHLVGWKRRWGKRGGM